MNNVLYRERCDKLSGHVAAGLNAMSAFASCLPEELLECDTFLCIDQIIVKWMTDRLLAEDTGAKLNELSIPQICEKRMKMHFGSRIGKAYRLLCSAYQLIYAEDYRCPDGFQAVFSQYQKADFPGEVPVQG